MAIGQYITTLDRFKIGVNMTKHFISSNGFHGLNAILGSFLPLFTSRVKYNKLNKLSKGELARLSTMHFML